MKTNWTKLVSLLILVLLMGLPAIAQTNDEVELIGTVEAMSIDTITVNNQEIDVTSAEINAQIELGTIVEVEGTLGSDGTITAREVNAVPDDFELGEAEFIGRLNSFDGSTLVINGQTIDTSNAQVQDGITFGGFVRVHAVANDDDTWTARAAAPFTPDDTDDSDDLGDDEFFIVGTLEEISDGTIMVAGQTVAIDETTELEDSLMVGLRTKVRVRVENDEWVALEVEHADDDDFAGDDGNDNDNNNTNSNANVNVNANNNANSNVNVDAAAISEQQATDSVLAIYPNTRITSMQLTEKFGGTLVWEVRTSHGIEVNIDAQNGTILTIERNGDTNVNANFNTNANENGNANFNANANVNSNTNINTNNNDNGNDNDDDDDDDNSGSGSGDDDDDDDNSGSGSGDDDD